MFDLGASELLLIIIVAILVIGPKDMPMALRTAGRWIGKMRHLSSHFRTGLDAMIREAEMEEMEKKWKAQNEKIMRQHPDTLPTEMEPTGALPPRRPSPAPPSAGTASPEEAGPSSVSAESVPVRRAGDDTAAQPDDAAPPPVPPRSS
jgi:sec-independent protein translocase protein TatB